MGHKQRTASFIRYLIYRDDYTQPLEAATQSLIFTFMTASIQFSFKPCNNKKIEIKMQ